MRKALSERRGRAPCLFVTVLAEERTNAQSISFFGETSVRKHALVLLGGFEDRWHVSSRERASCGLEDPQFACVLLGLDRSRRALARFP